MKSIHRRRLSTSRTSSKRRRGFTASASLSALLVIGGAVLGTASPAAAHDELLSAYPEASATVSDAPAEISLTFTGELQRLEGATAIEVITEDGRNLVDDAPEISEATVTQNLSDQLVVGEVTVRWRVVSSDGHPISDEYTFTVETTGAPPTSSPTSMSRPSPSEESTPTPTPTAESGYGDIHSQASTDLDALPVLVVAGGAALLGSAALLMFMAGRDRRRRDRAAQQKKENADES
ncbi:copper resistance CopC family protein [Microbacterium sp. OR21]|uniref:copper resistance CopC family protein n=1 Tax=Microbacterium sp. OR21 TaxID=3095346 RepID=UPI0039B4B5C7